MNSAARRVLLKALIALFSLLFITAAVLSLRLMLFGQGASGEYTQQHEAGRYHFMVILPAAEGNFFRELIAGVEQAAEEYGVGVEIQTPELSVEYEESIERLLRIARIARVDGVALYVTDEQRLRPLINRLVLDDIPVVTLESDAPASRRSSFIGTNSFHLGQRVGVLMREAHPEEVRAVILRSEYHSDKASQWSIIHYGIMAALADKPGNRILATVPTEGDVLSAEETSKQLLFLHPEANVILTTTQVDTITVARVLKQYRREASVTLIGHGYGEEIRSRLRTGELFATFVRDPRTIGRRGIGALYDHADGRYVPNSIYVDGDIRRVPGR
jgi:ribose transport system substrate-binding protein